MPMNGYLEAQGQCWVFFSVVLDLLFEAESLIAFVWSSLCEMCWLDWEPLELSYLRSPVWESQAMGEPGFYMGAWDTNTGPHAYPESDLPTKPFPQPCFYLNT